MATNHEALNCKNNDKMRRSDANINLAESDLIFRPNQQCCRRGGQPRLSTTARYRDARLRGRWPSTKSLTSHTKVGVPHASPPKPWTTRTDAEVPFQIRSARMR